MPSESQQTADFSLFIQHPSPDLQKDEEWMRGKEIFTSTQALRHLGHLEPMGQVNGNMILPPRVIKFLQSSIDEGNYRVELLDGETEYKLYRKFYGAGR